MKETDTKQQIIDMWRKLDGKDRVTVSDQLSQLLCSGDIESELNNERDQLQQEFNDMPGRDTDNSKHMSICGDINDKRVLSKIKSNGPVELVFTSPPYNADIQYAGNDDNLPIKEYLSFIKQSLISIDSVLSPGGRLVVNIRDISVGTGQRFPIIVELYKCLLGYDYRGLHIWYKGREESSFAWGSWKSSNNPAIIDLYEYVFVFQKPGEHNKGEDNLGKTEFIENVIGVWKIRPVKKISHKGNSMGHPCPFPIELANRVIKLYSHVGDTILDPFAGIMTTSISAAKAGRNSVAVDIVESYCKEGVKRFDQELGDMVRFGGVSINSI